MTTTNKEVLKDEFLNFIEYLKNSDVKVTIESDNDINSNSEQLDYDDLAINDMYNSCNDFYAYDNYAEFHYVYF